VLLVIAIPLALKASAIAQQGWGVLAAFVVIALALAAPIFLDLWAMVEADGQGVKWRNRLRTRRARWDEVKGFERSVRSMALRRTDGTRHDIRALGLRYFGSKGLAKQRVDMLDRLRRSAGRR